MDILTLTGLLFLGSLPLLLMMLVVIMAWRSD